MGGGGPAKAAQPTVTPFVDPAGPKNPIPNWFGGGSGSNAFAPDFTQSAKAFGSTAPALQQAPATSAPAQQSPVQTMQAPMQTMQQPDLQYAPDDGEVFRPHMRFAIPTQPIPAPHMRHQQRMLERQQRMLARRPTYTNYTDTNPDLSTDANGFSPMNSQRPNLWGL